MLGEPERVTSGVEHDIETGTCAAIALSWEGGGWGWSRAANRAWAEAQALARCSTVGYDCRVSVWACN